MKAQIVLMVILTWLVLIGVSFCVNAQYSPDTIITSSDGFWLDSRAKLNLSSAVTAIGSDVRDLVIAGSESVSSDLIIPATTHVRAMRGCAITVSAGKTLTINDLNIDAGDNQIFYGSGNVDFANGAVVRSTWFADFEEAVAETLNDTITLVVAATDTLAADLTIGTNVSLKWESEGAIINVSSGTTFGTIRDIVAGNYPIFGGTGNVGFYGIIINENWGSTVTYKIDDSYTGTYAERSGLIYYPTSGPSLISMNDAIESRGVDCIVKLTNNGSGVSSPFVIALDTVLSDHISLERETGAIIHINSGVTLTVDGVKFSHDTSQLFAGDGTVVGTLSCEYVTPEMWGAVGDGVTDDTTTIQKTLEYIVQSHIPLKMRPVEYYTSESLVLELANTVDIYGTSRGPFGTVINFNSASTDYCLDIYGMLHLNMSGIELDCNGSMGILFGDKDFGSEAYRAGLTLLEDIQIKNTGLGISFQTPGGYNRFERVGIRVDVSGGTAVDIGSDFQNTGTLPNYMFFEDCEFADTTASATCFNLNAAQYINVSETDIVRFSKGINIENSQEVQGLNVNDSFFFNNSNDSTSIYIDTSGGICRDLTFNNNFHVHSGGTFVNIQPGTNRVYSMSIDGDHIEGTLSDGYILNNVELNIQNMTSHFVDLNDKSTIGSSVDVTYTSLKPEVQQFTLGPLAGIVKNFEAPLVPVQLPYAVVNHDSGATVTQALTSDSGISVYITNQDATSQFFSVSIP